MPYYSVNHICPFTPAQQDALATRITHIHTRKFSAPSLFVNVVFENYSGKSAYVGGKRVTPTPFAEASTPFPLAKPRTTLHAGDSAA